MMTEKASGIGLEGSSILGSERGAKSKYGTVTDVH